MVTARLSWPSVTAATREPRYDSGWLSRPSFNASREAPQMVEYANESSAVEQADQWLDEAWVSGGDVAGALAVAK